MASTMFAPYRLSLRARTRSAIPSTARTNRFRPIARAYTTPSTSSRRTPTRAPWLLTLALFPALYLLLPPSLRPASGPPELDPQRYGTYRVRSVEGVSERHVLIEVDVPEGSRGAFRGLSASEGSGGPSSGSDADSKPGKTVTIRHVCIKSPDLQIERPYTPINDVAADGVLRLVVKRVRGGEVGRHIHSLKAGDPIEIRGPIRTAEVDLAAYDQVAMISTGTGIAPFLQLLSILRNIRASDGPAVDTPTPAFPRFTLIQYLPHSPFTRARATAPPSASSSATQLVPAGADEDPSGDHEDDPMDIALYPALVPRVLGAGTSLSGGVTGSPGLNVRFLRVQAGAQFGEADIAHAFDTSSDGGDQDAVADPSRDAQPASKPTGILSWLSSSSSGPTASTSLTLPSLALPPHRKALMLCLPLAQLPALVGPPPRGPPSMHGPLGGLLGRMGWTRGDVYVL